MPSLLNLDGDWILRDPLSGESYPARVPGCVHADLLRAKRIPPIDWRDNEAEQLWVARQTWTYERSFTLEAEEFATPQIYLCCEGLDTFATVSLNGEVVLQADNMFRSWEVPVRAALREGENQICIHFDSPLPHMAEANARHPLAAWNEFASEYRGRGHVRKMACAFGWDWGPRVASAGIWKSISLRSEPATHYAIEQIHADDYVQLKITPPAPARLLWQGEQIAESATGVLRVDQPKLWWPNGLGEQPLYELQVGDWQRRVGLRHIELRREPDDWGQSFSFVVNGHAIFAKGANLVPIHILLPTITAADSARVVRQAAEANMNMLRVWGGGIYESNAFYDACDEAGILLWQDLPFACGSYPVSDPDFRASVAPEVVDNVRRLRHHPSLALWCGNNELEQGFIAPTGENGMMALADYADFFDSFIPETIAAEDPHTPYWPGSSHTPIGDRYDYNNMDSGDAHLWSVWFGNEPFEAQRNWTCRFMSEYGFQSFPEMRTLASFTEAEDRNLTSYIVDFHQRSAMGNRTIFAYLLDWFPTPKTLDHQLWLSQLTQALCVEYAAVHLRRLQPRNQGCLYWQLNDIWPCASWSSVDSFGRWKALQHAARRFFAPIQLSIVEDDIAGEFRITLSNQTLKPIAKRVCWLLSDCAGVELASGSTDVSCPAQSPVAAGSVDARAFCEPRDPAVDITIVPPKNRALLCWAWLDGSDAPTLATLVRPKHLQLRTPQITHELSSVADGFVLTLEADVPAVYVRLQLADTDAEWSDNHFHLPAHWPRQIHLRPAHPLTIDDVRDRLRIDSLADIS
ncbi:MAG: beta-mannosidase [Rhodothermales bacterium]|jgi:beta-mannosidase